LKALALGAGGDQVAQCYQSGGAVRDCLNLAVSLGVVPRFEDYAEEIERAERSTGMAASCIDPHGSSRRESIWDLPDIALKEAQDAYNRGECGAIWEVMWPLAKSGSADARLYLLLTATLYMNPPGLDTSSPQTAWNRHLVTLSAYGALGVAAERISPDNKWLRNEIPRRLKELALGAGGDQVAQCYQSGGAVRDCLDLAVSLGVIPRFEDYAEEAERIERNTGMDASCRDQFQPNSQR
jgi:hypothetical protein